MSTPDIERITQLVRLAEEPTPLTTQVFALPDKDGGTKLVDLRSLARDPSLVKNASRSVRDTRSFLEYLDKHLSIGQTEVWADLEGSRIVAVIDAHEGAGEPASPNSHVVALDLVHTPEWKTWIESDNKKMTQIDFAEFIEANAADIVGDDGVTLLEVAQDLQGSTSVEWQSGQRLANGETKLAFKETVTARMGGQTDVVIPTKFTIAVKPYIGSARYRVGVSFRYQISGTSVKMSYHLDRPHATLEAAFDDMVREVQGGVPELTIDLDGDKDGAKLELPALPGVAPVLFGKPNVNGAW